MLLISIWVHLAPGIVPRQFLHMNIASARSNLQIVSDRPFPVRGHLETSIHEVIYSIGTIVILSIQNQDQSAHFIASPTARTPGAKTSRPTAHSQLEVTWRHKFMKLSIRLAQSSYLQNQDQPAQSYA